MSLGSSSGSIIQAISIMKPASQSNLTFFTSKHVFTASMMQTSMRSPVLKDKPDVTCPSDFPDSKKRQEVVHHEQIPDCDVNPSKKNAPDKKSNVAIKAKCFRDTEIGGILSGCTAREMASLLVQKMWTHLLLSDGKAWVNGHFRARWSSC